LVLAASPVASKYFKRQRRSNHLFFVVMEHKAPWVQANMDMQDYRTPIYTPGILYTYRIAVCNKGTDIIRGVEVRLTSIEPKPPEFHCIGGKLMFRHEQPTVGEKDIPPTQQQDFLDGVFVDVFCYFLNNSGSGNWLEARTTVRSPQALPLRNYTGTIIAVGRNGDRANSRFELILRKEGSPVLRLVK
jgi:hypothetical protein